MRARRRIKVGRISPEEKRKAAQYRRKNKAKLKQQAKKYYRKNRAKIARQRKQRKNRPVQGPARQEGVRYRYA